MTIIIPENEWKGKKDEISMPQAYDFFTQILLLWKPDWHAAGVSHPARRIVTELDSGWGFFHRCTFNTPMNVFISWQFIKVHARNFAIFGPPMYEENKDIDIISDATTAHVHIELCINVIGIEQKKFIQHTQVQNCYRLIASTSYINIDTGLHLCDKPPLTTVAVRVLEDFGKNHNIENFSLHGNAVGSNMLHPSCVERSREFNILYIVLIIGAHVHIYQTYKHKHLYSRKD
ncbi:hypothetical protein ACJX0J_006073 [Zea mays]